MELLLKRITQLTNSAHLDPVAAFPKKNNFILFNSLNWKYNNLVRNINVILLGLLILKLIKSS